MAKIHPAIAEHAVEENEKLRGLLRELREITSEYAWDADLEARVDAALSQQDEPDHVEDMRAMVEPAPAQDEREAFEVEFPRIDFAPAAYWSEERQQYVGHGDAFENNGSAYQRRFEQWKLERATRPAQDERTGYACHQCRAETPAPEPYKPYVVCQACGASTAATAAQALARPAQTVPVAQALRKMMTELEEIALIQPDRSKTELILKAVEALATRPAQTAPQPEQSSWIPVSERLPAEDDEVLCWCEDETVSWIEVSAHHNSFFTDMTHELLPVTHWMPQPAAPALAAQGESHE